MKPKGTIFNLQRFCTHDGPGIRTTIFMKGCPLRCKWCANPESQKKAPQLMVRPSKCAGCGACLDACPNGAITLLEGRPAQTRWQECQNCFDCVATCLYGAREIVGRKTGMDEAMEEILADRVFYKNSGGGLTISGGEPLLQHGFVGELLKESKNQGLHTALETCGHGSAKAIEALIPHLDLVLFDIKHLNPMKHIEYTGLDNRLILKNLRMLAREVECRLRIPLIQGINDEVAHIGEILDLAMELNIKTLSFLPYHEGGVGKARQIGMEYAILDAREPEDDHIRDLAAIARRKGIIISIGH